MSDRIRITVNEMPRETAPDTRLSALRDMVKPGADVVVLNGAPVEEDLCLSEGDTVVFIRRGEIPTQEELSALMLARHTPGIHNAVRHAAVGIAGAGGLGSAVADALARVGVGRLVVADFDVVEPSNLNRQHFFIDQTGLLKVYALKENLQRVNPCVEVVAHPMEITPERIPVFFNRVQVMVEALDSAETKAMFIEQFRKRFPGIPLVAASGLAGHGSSNSIITRKAGSNFYLTGDLESGTEPGRGLMAPRVGIAAYHQANAVLQLLTGNIPC